MLNQSKPCVSPLAVPEEFICIPSLTALHIEAEVVRWVYTVGSEKPLPKIDALKAVSHQTSGFFSSLFAGFGSSTPRRMPTPAPVVPKESIKINLLEAHSSSVVLTIFIANVDVRLNKKMTAELQRSTKKNPPSRLRYELIYVSLYAAKTADPNQFSRLIRQGRMNMTQVSRRRRKPLMLPGACFKA